MRTALTLSMITGQAFRITNIRARRAKPGLMRQHLVAVQAAAQVSDAVVTGAEVGAQALTFAPTRIKSGDYQFAIGTAGSCTLVLQTILPALLYADAASTVRITGGTHNPMAPPVQFLQRAYCRLLAAMGAQVDIEILRCGFYPAGGGVLLASVSPCSALRPLELLARGKRLSGYAESIVAGVSARASHGASLNASVPAWDGTSRNCWCAACRPSRGRAMRCSSRSSTSMSAKYLPPSAKKWSGRKRWPSRRCRRRAGISPPMPRSAPASRAAPFLI